MKKRILLTGLCTFLLAAGCVIGFVIGGNVSKKKATTEALVSQAHLVATELETLRCQAYANEQHLQTLEVHLDCLLSSLSDYSPYRRLSWLERDMLQDIRRYRSKFPRRLPGPEFQSMVSAPLVYPRAREYLDTVPLTERRPRVL